MATLTRGGVGPLHPALPLSAPRLAGGRTTARGGTAVMINGWEVTRYAMIRDEDES
jgi:hypothetical protein